MKDIEPVPDEYGYILSPITDGARFSDIVEQAQEDGTLQKVGTCPPTLWGPEGSLARFTRAAKGIHDAAEKVRAIRMKQNDQEVEQIVRDLANIHGGSGLEFRPSLSEVMKLHLRARAAIAALDQVRGE